MTGRFEFRDPQVNLYVRDVEASVRFYTGTLGFTETFRTPGTGTPVHAELRLGGLVLGLAAIDSALDTHGLVVGGGPARAEVAVWTDDVDEVYGGLTGRGVVSLSPPHDFGPGLRAAWIADPDGHPVQIVARRP
jgi:catechol 2,3-dioxygenase-like lactoylglutathione lyase family enzyme